MKIHRPTVHAVIFALQSIFEEQRYADKVLEYTFRKNKKLGSRDRRWIAESVYDIVRWWRKIWFLLDRQESLDEESLLFVFQVWLWQQEISPEVLPEDLRRELDVEKLSARETLTQDVRALRESIPAWLDELGDRELGEKWPPILKAMNKKADVVLRANLLRGNALELQKKMADEGVVCEVLSDESLYLPQRANVFKTECFRQGLFEVQDFSSQQIAPLLQLSPGLRVIDACAGAGGKSLHIASLMQDRGKVLALDVGERKLGELKQRARRNGYSSIETRLISSSKVIKRLKESADRVLLDVPCSGLGVLKRNPDTKWKFNEKERERLLSLQAEIIENYSKMVKKGGILVYSTCSVLPSENSEQVSAFLEKNSDWKKVEEKSFRPDQTIGDGFFAAVLKRDE